MHCATRWEREKITRGPKEVLTKLMEGDVVEAYLEVFEQTARREKWPVAEWAAGLPSPHQC